MPRNLTDLMERAVASAPPESHHAADITRLAQRHQRRRTTFVAGAASLAVVAVAGLTVGLTQQRPSTPEPAGRYLHDQTVDAASAVPASAVPGYRTDAWTIPSMQHLGHGRYPAPTYRDVDAEGRLIVEDFVGTYPHETPRIRLFDGPGQAPRALQHPPSPGSNGGNPITWVPSFLDAGHLIWTPDAPIMGPAKAGFHLTDLDGGNDVFVGSHFEDGSSTLDGTPRHGRAWVWGDHVWFLSYDSATAKGGISYSLYSATFAGAVTKVADHVAAADVSDGVAAWVTTDGNVLTESAEGGPQRDVTVPLTAGCAMPSTDVLQSTTGSQYLAVSRSVIALTETCRSGTRRLQELLAFDLTGRLLVHVTGLYALSPSLGRDDLVFQGLEPPGLRHLETLRYDLVTGSLAALESAGGITRGGAAEAAGDHVLWYDGKGGHVGEFTE